MAGYTYVTYSQGSNEIKFTTGMVPVKGDVGYSEDHGGLITITEMNLFSSRDSAFFVVDKPAEQNSAEEDSVHRAKIWFQKPKRLLAEPSEPKPNEITDLFDASKLLPESKLGAFFQVVQFLHDRVVVQDGASPFTDTFTGVHQGTNDHGKHVVDHPDLDLAIINILIFQRKKRSVRYLHEGEYTEVEKFEIDYKLVAEAVLRFDENSETVPMLRALFLSARVFDVDLETEDLDAVSAVVKQVLADLESAGGTKRRKVSMTDEKRARLAMLITKSLSDLRPIMNDQPVEALKNALYWERVMTGRDRNLMSICLCSFLRESDPVGYVQDLLHLERSEMIHYLLDK